MGEKQDLAATKHRKWGKVWLRGVFPMGFTTFVAGDSETTRGEPELSD